MKKLLAGFCLIALPFSFVWADTSLLQGAIVYSPNKISKFDWLQGYDGSQPCGSCTGSPSVRNGACGIDTSVSGFQFQINTNGQAACNNIVVWQCPPPANSKNKPHSLLGVNPCNFNNAYAIGVACGGDDNKNPDKSCKLPLAGQYQYDEGNKGTLKKVTYFK
ncbi:hypothetical protein [Coxiella burnetii]|uniref:hypothetical protein n=2 Tax=Coxiella burnetii TaxID=777 RepID=UPI000163A58F|nr:hypothetical protein [Coxiella burnetii]AIT63666.1 putative exported protein [Coxiella burnetii str. Namibia]ATN86222.1 hypothetical protein AYO29_07100 [Coxiella burnetii str. Schperling]EDR35039.1 hypothetical protein COXBURSA334_1614 [Coxiella burnetii Q321]PHH56699.1 hypothetical protein CRH12_09385 [Coxiella burnetii]